MVSAHNGHYMYFGSKHHYLQLYVAHVLLGSTILYQYNYSIRIKTKAKRDFQPIKNTSLDIKKNISSIFRSKASIKPNKTRKLARNNISVATLAPFSRLSLASVASHA